MTPSHLLFVYLAESDMDAILLSPRNGGIVLISKWYVFECFEAVSFEEEDQ